MDSVKACACIFLIIQLIVPIRLECIQRRKQFSKKTETIGTPRVCSACRPGEYVNKYCSTSNRTNRCEACPTGFYMTKWNLCRTCHKCTECSDRSLTEQTPCTSTSDRTCQCRNGFYKKTKKQKSKCSPHRKCRPGQGVTGTGSSIRNVECSKCSRGFFQPNVTSTARCSQHKVCEHGVKLRGNRKQDNICNAAVTTAITIRTRTTVDFSTFVQPLIDMSTVNKSIKEFSIFGGKDAKIFESTNYNKNGSFLSGGVIGAFVTAVLIVPTICIIGVLFWWYCRCQPRKKDPIPKHSNRSLNEGRCVIKAECQLLEIFWFLAQNISVEDQQRFYTHLKVKPYKIEDIKQIYHQHGSTTEKYMVLLAWHQQYGEHGTLDALLEVLDKMELAGVKAELINKFCQVSPVKDSRWV